MRIGNVVMTVRPTRTSTGARIREARSFLVVSYCASARDGADRIHVTDKTDLWGAFPPHCMLREDLMVL